MGAGFTIGPGVYTKGEFGMRSVVDVYIGRRGVEVTSPTQQQVTAVLEKVTSFCAAILAGGRARRLGGARKALSTVDGPRHPRSPARGARAAREPHRRRARAGDDASRSLAAGSPCCAIRSGTRAARRAGRRARLGRRRAAARAGLRHAVHRRRL
jgi:hypothetical protein